MKKATRVEVARFVIGLLLIGYPILALAFAGVSISLFPAAIIGTPLLYSMILLIAAGIYFLIIPKVRKLDALVVVIAVVGILISHSVVSGFGAGSTGSAITGTIPFQVKILGENAAPLAGIEVDIAETPGPPPEGGVATTDENGVAQFTLKAGKYWVFFNTNNFPQAYVQPNPVQISVPGDGEKEITLARK
ncbi:MAG: hypothetical protein AB1476_03550 [Candidatus Hadarchaeota archaeon]